MKNAAYDKVLKPIVLTVKKHPQIAVGFAVFSLLGAGMLAYYLSKGSKTSRYAKKWVGEKEIAGNMGFKNDEFDRLMREYGDFRDTQAWCMSFAKMVWMKKANKKYEDIINRLITPSTQQTWQRFTDDNSGLFEIGDKAKKGAIAIWQKYKDGHPTYQGHAGIVTKVKKDKFYTIEGNTNKNGGREGIEVANKERTYNFNTKNGLRLKGFISFSPKIKLNS